MFEVTSARSKGSVRRLNIFGTRRETRTAQPKCAACQCTLLQEDQLPVVVAHGDEVAIVGEVEERIARAVGLLPGQVRQQIVPIEVDLEGLGAGLMPRLQLRGDVRLAGRGQERGSQSR